MNKRTVVTSDKCLLLLCDAFRGEVVIDRKNVGGWTPLMYACYIGHDHIASLLIDAGCNVNMKNQRGQVPLMLAASCGNETVGRTLLRVSVDWVETERERVTAWTGERLRRRKGERERVTAWTGLEVETERERQTDRQRKKSHCLDWDGG